MTPLRTVLKSRSATLIQMQSWAGAALGASSHAMAFDLCGAVLLNESSFTGAMVFPHTAQALA
jgi:hypothetical protein